MSNSSTSLPVIQPTVADGLLADARPCTLSQCRPGVRATVLGLEDCGTDEACRLRSLGLCEGTAVSVSDPPPAWGPAARDPRPALAPPRPAGTPAQPPPAAAAPRG